MSIPGELQCSRRPGAHRLRWSIRMVHWIAVKRGSFEPYGCGHWRMGFACWAKHQLPQLRTDSQFDPLLWDTWMPALGCVGASEFNKGMSDHLHFIQMLFSQRLCASHRFIHWNIADWLRTNAVSYSCKSSSIIRSHVTKSKTWPAWYWRIVKQSNAQKCNWTDSKWSSNAQSVAFNKW